MKKLGIGLLLCILLVGACAGITHWRYNADRLNQALNQMTPIGSSYDDVWRTVSAKYAKTQRNDNAGFLRQDAPKSRVVGVKSISANIGDYYAFPIGTTSIVAYWGFDRDNRLIDIWVWKSTDSI
jgi:hypothetical protein